MTHIDPHGLLREIASIIERADAESRDLTPVEDAWCGVLLDVSEAQTGAWPPLQAPLTFEYSDDELDLAISILRLKCSQHCGVWSVPAQLVAGVPDAPPTPDDNAPPSGTHQSEIDFWTMSAT